MWNIPWKCEIFPENVEYSSHTDYFLPLHSREWTQTIKNLSDGLNTLQMSSAVKKTVGKILNQNLWKLEVREKYLTCDGLILNRRQMLFLAQSKWYRRRNVTLQSNWNQCLYFPEPIIYRQLNKRENHKSHRAIIRFYHPRNCWIKGKQFEHILIVTQKLRELHWMKWQKLKFRIKFNLIISVWIYCKHSNMRIYEYGISYCIAHFIIP